MNRQWFKSGTPWIWMNAGAIAIALVAVFGLLLLILFRGMSHFWPANVDAFHYDNGTNSLTVIAEIVESEIVPAEALHGLEGLKHMESSIVPEIFDRTVPDEILPVGTEAGWDMSDRLAAQEGLHVGHSTGANVAGALEIAKRIGEGCIVAIACDRGDRYFAPMKWEKHYEW